MKKNLLLGITMFATLLLAGAGCATFDSLGLANSANNTASSTSPTSSVDGSDELAVVADVEPGVEMVTTPTGTIEMATKGYLAAISTYGKSGMRFQFDQCSGTPGTLTVKKGVKFMIDNRDGMVHMIGIGARKYSLGEYGYAIVTVQTAGSFNITCDGGGAAHVTVQN